MEVEAMSQNPKIGHRWQLVIAQGGFSVPTRAICLHMCHARLDLYGQSQRLTQACFTVVSVFPQEIFGFWMAKGVDGFLVDDVHTIFEHEIVTMDEPVNELVENPIPVRFVGHFTLFSHTCLALKLHSCVCKPRKNHLFHLPFSFRTRQIVPW